MKDKLKLERLKSSLNPEIIQALETEGFFDASAEVKRLACVDDTKSLNEGERTVERYISTRTIDRDMEVLDPAGCVMDAYLKNPVVLWAHDYSQPPIAKAEWVKRDEFGVRSKTVYAETERAEEVWQLIKGGFLQTASVGFMPLKRIWKGDPEWRDNVQKYNEKWGIDLEQDGAQCITTKWVLLEYSDVPVPANPDALTYNVAKGMGLSQAMIDALELGADPDAEPEPEPEKSAPIVRPYTPPAPEPKQEEAPPAPEPEPIKRIVTLVKPAPVPVIRPIRPAPKQADLIAHIAHETVSRLTGKL